MLVLLEKYTSWLCLLDNLLALLAKLGGYADYAG
jgi:hypothetical protein